MLFRESPPDRMTIRVATLKSRPSITGKTSVMIVKTRKICPINRPPVKKTSKNLRRQPLPGPTLDFLSASRRCRSRR